MRILLVSSQFPNCQEPNRGVFTAQIARELSRSAELRVVAPVPTLGMLKGLGRFKRYQTDLPIPAREVIDGLEVQHPTYFAAPGLGVSHPFSLLPAVGRVMEELWQTWRYDAVNCHWLFPDGVAVQQVCRRLGVPVLLTALGTDLNRYSTYRWRRLLLGRALRGADRVSVLSGEMRDTCLGLGVAAERLSVIANGVDLETFSPLDRSECRQALGLDPVEPALLFVGSLVPVKNVQGLLRAFALLQGGKRSPRPRLYLVGHGFLREELQRLAQELSVADLVRFVGAVPHRELPVWMSAADCLCLPSHSEGHPNVMMEALACGTPVVGSRVGSLPDFVGGARGNGFIAQGSDPADLADKLTRCLEAGFRREAVRATVAGCSWSACAQNYHDTLASLCSP